MGRKIIGSLAALRIGLSAAAVATGGGVAIPFALSVVPLTMMAIAGLDFERSEAVRANLQDSLDAAALTVGRSTVTDAVTIQSMGASALATNLNLPSGIVLTNSTFTLTGTQVKASANVKIKAMAADVFSSGNIIVGARSTVQRAMYKVEVALVLDNTGSMAGTKLSLLKTAANNFVDTLTTAAAQSGDPSTVKIGLVPFSQTVKVGATYRNQTWIDQNGDAPINDEIFANSTGPVNANRFTLLSEMGVSWGGCVESRQAPYDVQDTPPDTTNPATLFTPYFAPDEPTYDGKTSQLNGFYNSYLTSDGTTSTTWWVRQGNVAKYNHRQDKTGTIPGLGYQYGPNAGCELGSLVRLTTTGSTVKTGIAAMAASGDTNIPMGMMWGWHLLSPNLPFSDGQPYGTKGLQKIIVLMTDGQNQNTASGNGNASYYSGDGYIWQNRIGVGSAATASQRQAALDARLALLCTNAKNAGITIYTVRVDVNDNNYAVLQTCATKPSMFFDVSDANDLDQTFKTIAGSIENLRIAS